MSATIIIPCYNEAKRLNREKFAHFKAWPEIRLLFVNDGSKDDTDAALNALAQTLPGSEVMSLQQNSGKAEAVRQGMLRAIEEGATLVGYYDADLSTPPNEMHGIVKALKSGQYDVALGSRVKLLGRHIERQASRHYLGRIFATAASIVLKMPVYDTQCGAKAFRVIPALKDALSEPFSSRWAFDVELIGRLHYGRQGVSPVDIDKFIEVPLDQWIHVGGSKVRLSDFPRMAWDLLKIRIKLSSRKSSSKNPTH